MGIIPFFKAVVMVIESMHEKTEEAMCKLLQALFRSFVITFDQMKNVSITELTFFPNLQGVLKQNVVVKFIYSEKATKFVKSQPII